MQDHSNSRLSRRRFTQAMLAATAVVAAPMVGRAQDKSPARLIVGFPPGGSFDTIARLLAENMKADLGRSIVVENRAGAGGIVAVDMFRTAPNDGSVVMLGPDALTSIYTLTYKRLNYDAGTDLVPISSILEFPFSFAAGTQPPARTLDEYVQWARANPEKANFGHPASGSPHHFFGLLLGKAIGVDMAHIPFQGAGPMMVNLMGGQISAGIEVMGGMMEHHRHGKLRILAISAPKRVPQLPDVPTFTELGYPSIRGMGFNGLYAPRGTPREAVMAWNSALHQALADPGLEQRFMELGYLVSPSTPEGLAERSAESRNMWAPIVKESGFSVD